MEIIGPVRIDPEAQRRDNLRQNHLVPIYVMWTSDVPENEAQYALQGVLDTVDASGQNRAVKVFGSQPWSQGNFSGADWYLKEAFRRQDGSGILRERGHGAQLSTNNLMNLFYEEPWQSNPHWEVMIVNTDLWSGKNDNNYVFGLTRPSFPASIQSVRRFVDSIRPGLARSESIRRLLRHEVGHMFNIPLRNYNVEQNLGKHCISDICTMRQGLTIQDWARNAEVEYNSNTHFCAGCHQDFTDLKVRYLPVLDS